MIVHLNTGQKVRRKHTDDEGFVHFEVVDRAGTVTYQGFARPDATIDIRDEDGSGVVGTMDEVMPPDNHRRQKNDPRQNPRV